MASHCFRASYPGKLQYIVTAMAKYGTATPRLQIFFIFLPLLPNLLIIIIIIIIIFCYSRLIIWQLSADVGLLLLLTHYFCFHSSRTAYYIRFYTQHTTHQLIFVEGGKPSKYRREPTINSTHISPELGNRTQTTAVIAHATHASPSLPKLN
jgi:hypothetical protein